MFVILPDAGQPVPATDMVGQISPDMDRLLHLHLHKYHEPTRRDMLCAIPCRGTFWLRGLDCEVYRFGHEVIDLTQEGDDHDANLDAQLN